MRDHLRRNWRAGQHFAILAPTEAGKTVLAARGLIPLWNHALILDPKGDDNLPHARAIGAKVVRAYPRPDPASLWGGDPYPERYYWIHPPERDRRMALYQAMRSAWRSSSPRDGGWVVYVDEIKLLSDPKELNLEPQIIRMLRYGRGRRLTFIGGTQSPRWNGRAMGDLYDQPRWFAIGHTTDRRTIDRYGEISGFDLDVARHVIPRLGEHEFWFRGPGRWQAISTYPLRGSRRLELRSPSDTGAPAGDAGGVIIRRQ